MASAEDQLPRRAKLAAAREKRQRIEFWQSLPEGERHRLCIWFAKQFGVEYQSTPPEPKASAPQKLITASSVEPKPVIPRTPLHPRIPKEKPPWWKR